MDDDETWVFASLVTGFQIRAREWGDGIMRWITHKLGAAIIGFGMLTLLASTANAQWGGYSDYSGSGYGWPGGVRQQAGYGGGNVGGYNGGYNGGYGAGYGSGYESYYGNGGHDAQPHWHSTQTPFRNYQWYGTGRHDFVPHQHIRTPNSYQGYSSNPWSSTQSYYPTQPYYSPW